MHRRKPITPRASLPAFPKKPRLSTLSTPFAPIRSTSLLTGPKQIHIKSSAHLPMQYVGRGESPQLIMFTRPYEVVTFTQFLIKNIPTSVSESTDGHPKSIMLPPRYTLFIPSQGTRNSPLFAYRIHDTYAIMTGCFHGLRSEYLRCLRGHMTHIRRYWDSYSNASLLWNPRLEQIDLIRFIDRTFSRPTA